MAKHTIPGAIYVHIYEGRMSDTLHFSPYSMAAPFIKVCDHTITVDVADDFDYRSPAVAALEAQKQFVRAEFAKKVKELDEQIGKLLCIECSAEAA